MSTISLHGKTGEIVLATSHPEFLDFGVRCSRTTTSEARVEISDENFVATADTIGALDGKTAIETYPLLTRTLADVTQKHPHREDALLVLTFLIAASRPYPQARWRTIGADRLPKGVRYIERATTPRFFPTAKTRPDDRGQDVRRGVLYVRLTEGWQRATEAIRMLPDGSAPRSTVNFGADWDDQVTAKTLQREVRIQPTGGGSKGRSRKKPPKAGDLPMTGSAGGYDETPIRREVLSMRVDTTAKDALVASGVGRDLIEMLGRAIASGRTIDDVRAALRETA